MCMYVFLSWISSEVEVNHLAHIISLNWHIDILKEVLFKEDTVYR